MSFPQTQRVHLFGGVYVTLTRSADGLWSATTDVPTRFGPVRLTAEAHEDTITAAYMAASGSRLGAVVSNLASMVSAGDVDVTDPAVSAFFANLGTTFQAATRTSAFRDLVAKISALLANPIFQVAVSAIGVGIGASLDYVACAASLLSRARAGDPSAVAGVRQISRGASSDPNAARAWRTLQALGSEPSQMSIGCDGRYLPDEVDDARYRRMVDDYRGRSFDMAAGADGVYRLGARAHGRGRYGLAAPAHLVRRFAR